MNILSLQGLVSLSYEGVPLKLAGRPRGVFRVGLDFGEFLVSFWPSICERRVLEKSPKLASLGPKKINMILLSRNSVKNLRGESLVRRRSQKSEAEF